MTKEATLGLPLFIHFTHILINIISVVKKMNDYDIKVAIDIIEEANVDTKGLRDSTLVSIYEIYTLTYNICRKNIQFICNYFIQSNRYSKYLEYRENLKESPLKTSTFKYDMAQLLQPFNKEKDQTTVNNVLDQIICMLYMEQLASSLSDTYLIRIINIGLKKFWIHGIDELLGDFDRDVRILAILSLFKSMALTLYKGIQPVIYEDKLYECYCILKKLRKNKIKAYVNKAHLLGEENSEIYKLYISIEFIMSMLDIRIKLRILDNIEELDIGVIKYIIDIINSYGIDSPEYNKYMDKIISKSARKSVIELRKKYNFITKDILSDEEILKISKLELAGINYAIKNGEYTPYYRRIHNFK